MLVLGGVVGLVIGLGSTAATGALLVVILGVVVVAAWKPAPRARASIDLRVSPATLPVPPDVDDPLLVGLGAATLLTLLIVAADTQGYTGASTNKRYALLVVPVFALLLAAARSNRSRVDSPTAADRYLAVYAILGLAGSLVGKLFLGTVDSAVVIFLPMFLGLTHLLVRERMTAARAARYQRALIRITLVFLVLSVLSESSAWPLAKPSYSPQERAFFIAVGLAAAAFSRRRAIVAVMLAFTTIMFLQYPAATWVIVAMSGLVTGFATSRRGRRSGAGVLIVFAVGLLGIGFAQVQGGQSSIAKSYFSAVAKVDNTSTRRELWKAAEQQIAKSPLVGSMFSGDFTVANVNRVITNQSADARIEPHNDYLETLLLGGFFGLVLYGAFIVSANVIVIRRVRLLTAEGAVPEVNLARVLLIGFNAVVAGAAFNPELSSIGICASVFLVYALMMTVRPMTTGPADRSLRVRVVTAG